jgi:hypothetical protein
MGRCPVPFTTMGPWPFDEVKLWIGYGASLSCLFFISPPPNTGPNGESCAVGSPRLVFPPTDATPSAFYTQQGFSATRLAALNFFTERRAVKETGGLDGLVDVGECAAWEGV